MPAVGPGTGTRLWTPLDDGVPNLAAWYDAADTSTFTPGASGAQVSAWKDKSPNRYDATQSTSAAQPSSGTRSRNGYNVLEFDGTSDLLPTTSLPSTFAAATHFAVFLSDTASGQQAIFGSSTTGGLELRINTKLEMLRQGTASIASGSTTIAASTPYLTATTRTDNAGYAFRLNGASDGAGSGGGAWGGNYIATIGCGHPSGAGERLDGWIAEIVVYGRVLAPVEIALIERYLSAKWGIPLATGGACSPPLVFA